MSGQNTSHAVMAQRFEPADSLDYFPTPPWATRALCEWLINSGCNVAGSGVWEPACGEGHMARALGEYFHSYLASDVHDYGCGYYQDDFLFPSENRANWIVTNPPFNLAMQFAQVAHERAMSGVALLVRTAFLEGVTRHRELFSKLPPSHVLQFTERVPMHKGRLVKDGSTATAYCWIVWRKDAVGGTRFEWIAPCRKRLERDEDYS